jgi:hypothetical protein
MSRDELASHCTAAGVVVDSEDIRHIEVRCRRPPDPEKLRAVAVELGIGYEEIAGTVISPEGLGLAPW